MQANVLSLPLMNLKELAERLRVSRKTLYYWVSRNEVPYLKIGRHLRFDYQAVLDFFEERTRGNRVKYRVPLSDYGPAGSLKTRKSTRNRNFAPETE